MPIFLSNRNEGLREQMDDPECDPAKLKNTYRQFTTVNRLISGWSRIYRSKIRPVIDAGGGTGSILDIGCGGGDLIRLLHKLALKDGRNIQITGIDPDSRAIRFANEMENSAATRFLNLSSEEMVNSGEKFDIVISNHLLHHLTGRELKSVCRDAGELARKLVLFNDIERSDIGFAAFCTISPVFFRNSFIAEDGCTSIRRSYRRDELQQALPGNWQVKRMFPFRLLACYKKSI